MADWNRRAAKDLEQTCPKCGTTEAAGGYCTKCLTRMTPADHHPPKRSDAQIATAQRLNAHRSKGSSRG